MKEVPVFTWLIAVLLLGCPFVYLVGQIGRRTGAPKLAWGATLAVLVGAWVPFVLTAQQLNSSGVETYMAGGIALTMDGIGLLLAAVALGLGSLVVLFSGPYLSAEDGQEKFYAMLLAMIGVMIGLGCATDLFNLWIWFEAMAVSSYLLVAFYREQPTSLEAGVKYLVQSAAGSVLVLLGIGLVFSTTGTLDLAEIRAVGGSAEVLVAAGALFVIGYGVKTALVPLHTWLPDAHSQAPSGISAMLSGIVIEAGLIAMLRSLSGLSATPLTWGVTLMAFGALNMLAGNLLALRQKQVKRMLAYSSLVHVGYMLVALGIAIYFGQQNGAEGGFFHLFNHGLMKGLAFLAAGTLLYVLHISAGEHGPLTTSDLNGAARRYPWVALTLSIALLSLGGLPPLARFMSKWQIFVGGFQTENLLVGLLVIFAALNSVLSLAYYAPLINAVYRREPSEIVHVGRPVPWVMNAPLLLMAASVVIIGLWPSIMSWLTEPAGSALLAAFGG